MTPEEHVALAENISHLIRSDPKDQNAVIIQAKVQMAILHALLAIESRLANLN